MNHLRFDRMAERLAHQRTRYDRVVAFRPTGWTFTPSNASSTSLIRKQSREALIIYGIPYSEHSSFDELCDFISDFQPQEIIPTVNVKSSAAQVALLSNR